MKKIATLFSLFAIFTATQAQLSQFQIQHFDLKIPGRVSVFSGNRLLGTTDTLGFLELPTREWFVSIVLKQNDGVLNYEIVDTTQFGMDWVGKSYIIRIEPETTEEAVVKAIRSWSEEPHTKTEITRQELSNQNTGRDLPIMLQFQPSVITSSDAGNGIGYTGIRVRGSDASRTNITINGVPINDAESQSTFWVNMPDLGASVQSIQLQRGVGSSTNGAGAFGASVNIQTATSFKPYGQLSQSFGSYNTRKTTLAAGTGLIEQHWTLDFRLSNIQSDGFIDRAKSKLNSWFASGGYYARKWSVKLLAFSGEEQSYQAWYGIPREKMYGNDSALKAHYQRNKGVIYRNAADSINLFGSNKRRYNYYNYENETDNYKQSHYHFYFNSQINKHNSFNVTLYKTLGRGYFEQFRPLDSLSAYGMKPAIFGNDTMLNSDIIRRRWLDNTLTGINANWIHSKRKITLTNGGGYNQYFGDHFGEIVWARIAPMASHLSNYYSATGDKFDGNIFTKAVFHLQPELHISTDLQIRRVYHTGRGFDNNLRPIRFTGNYLFFNPKLGISKLFGNGTFMYTSVSLSGKEPARSDYTDNPIAYAPKQEQLLDYEFGYVKKTKKLSSAINFYFMDYKNQLVLTGAVNDVGTPLRTNVTSSFRAGIELSGLYNLSKHFKLNGNIAFSRNNINTIFIQTLDYADYSVQLDTLENVPLSYSPNVVGALAIEFSGYKNWNISWNHKYVGSQFLDNTGNDDKKLNAYYFSEIWITKTLKLSSGTIDIKLQILNVLNSLYSNNGYAFEYLYGAGNLTREVYLFPSAPRNAMFGMVLKF